MIEQRAIRKLGNSSAHLGEAAGGTSTCKLDRPNSPHFGMVKLTHIEGDVPTFV